MDVQNAAESDQTKAADASPGQQGQKSVGAKPSQDEATVKAGSDDKDTQGPEASNDVPDDRDSDAETIVLDGKVVPSPSKARKVRQEDKSDGDADASKGNGQTGSAADDGETKDKAPTARGDSGEARGKRSSDAHDKDKAGRSKDDLSSAPTSPSQTRRRRRSANSRSSLSDHEETREKYSKTLLRGKPKSGESLLSNKRKAPKTESDDEEYDSRKARRQRTASAGTESGRLMRERRASTSKSTHDTRNRSVSPPHRSHRRSASTQLSSSNGAAAKKKKRLPPPLQPTDYNSDESSASGSPHPRNTKTRSLAASSAGDNISPAKMPSHKKHLDAHGQTLLARACARGEFEGAKGRLKDRPEDLNVADYAGNTPLQIAAINGCEDIVELLIDAGCNVDCVNYDKDTPLLDAVDNGHLGVVKLLLDAGVNPRKANVNGEEPIDRVTEDTDNGPEIRALLIEAKKRFGGRTKTSEDRQSHLDSHDGPESPRRSPAATTSSSRRGGNVRSTKTRNDLLYQPLDDKTLRSAAGRGDEEMVARILQVKGSCDDAEPMVAAARGGHDLVIQLLLGLGGADPDPEPVPSQPSDFATPILAAIGQENIKVLELLLEQQSVDPTKRIKGETYYEIAKRRQGTNWKEEEQKLKDAYDAYKSQKPKTKSPGRRDRDKTRDEKRSRREEKSESRPHRREPSSPNEKKRSDSQTNPSEEKRATMRQRREDRKSSTAASDREVSPVVPHKHPKAKRTESEVALSSEGESVKPRRKLISKGELRGERDKRRRSSVTSQTSNAKEPSSPHDSRHDDSSEKTQPSEKYHDRTKALKKEESKDASSGDNSASKRHRSSLTPEQSHNGESENSVKRRRLEGDGTEKRQKRPTSTEGASAKGGSTTDKKDLEHEKNSRRASGGDASVRIKSEEDDVEMPDADFKAPEKGTPGQETGHDSTSKKKKKKEAAAADEDSAQEAERRRLEAEDKKKKQEAEVVEKQRKEEEAREAEEKRQQELERQKEEEKRLAEEKARHEAEEKARRDEEEKQRLEQQQKKEEEERKKREEEEERNRKEREAAEEARRQREEEERKERERRERAHREELERKRAAREAEMRRLREEQEKARLDKLPPLLRWLDTCPNPKNPAYAVKFKTMQGVRYDTIKPEANRTPQGREQWVLNTHAALLLGEKDLDLSRYTDWDRIPVSNFAKVTLWRVENRLYSLLDEKTWDLGSQLPDYYGAQTPLGLSFQAREELKKEAWERFRNMDLFFVKVSDLLYTVPNIPHLRNIKLAVMYRELIENEAQMLVWRASQKWKQDPDANRFGGVFGPRNQYYVNGTMVGEDIPKPSETSATPFPEKQVPRRGLLQVFPDDPDYSRICIEQGLEHLINGHKDASLPNGVHSPPTSQTADTESKIEAIEEANQPHAGTNGSLVNGVNGSGN